MDNIEGSAQAVYGPTLEPNKKSSWRLKLSGIFRISVDEISERPVLSDLVPLTE